MAKVTKIISSISNLQVGDKIILTDLKAEQIITPNITVRYSGSVAIEREVVVEYADGITACKAFLDGKKVKVSWEPFDVSLTYWMEDNLIKGMREPDIISHNNNWNNPPFFNSFYRWEIL